MGRLRVGYGMITGQLWVWVTGRGRACASTRSAVHAWEAPPTNGADARSIRSSSAIRSVVVVAAVVVLVVVAVLFYRRYILTVE